MAMACESRASSALSAGLTGSTLLSPRGNLGVPTSRATSPMAPLSLILRSLQAEKYTITTQYFYNSHFHQKFIFKIFFTIFGASKLTQACIISNDLLQNWLIFALLPCKKASYTVVTEA